MTLKMAVRGPDRAEVLMYGDIGAPMGAGAITASAFAKELKALGRVKSLDIRLNSYGGDVFEGLTIYRQIVDSGARVTVYIDGIAGSIASVIAMAGSDIRIAQSGFVMIHDAYANKLGNAVEHREFADRLEAASAAIADIYASRTKRGLPEIRKMMAAETWLTAAEAVGAGFANSIQPNMSMAAKVSPARFQFRNMPQHLAPRRKAAASAVTQMRSHLITQRPKVRS